MLSHFQCSRHLHWFWMWRLVEVFEYFTTLVWLTVPVIRYNAVVYFKIFLDCSFHFNPQHPDTRTLLWPNLYWNSSVIFREALMPCVSNAITERHQQFQLVHIILFQVVQRRMRRFVLPSLYFALNYCMASSVVANVILLNIAGSCFVCGWAVVQALLHFVSTGVQRSCNNIMWGEANLGRK